MNLFDRLIMPCRLPAWACFMRPVAVTLKRFLALDFVFILGIFFSGQRRPAGAGLRGRRGSPDRPAARVRARLMPEAGGRVKGPERSRIRAAFVRPAYRERPPDVGRSSDIRRTPVRLRSDMRRSLVPRACRPRAD